MERDEELVARCRKADAGAWMQLIQRHTREVYSYCYRFTGRQEEAEDLTQEIFLKIFKAIADFDPSQASFATWLNRVARNHLVDHYRRTKKDRVTSSLEDEMPHVTEDGWREEHPLDRVERSERREALQTALGRLSPDLREAVVLRDLQGLEYTEISEVLGVPRSTVKSRIHRGRLELGKVLDAQRAELV